MRPSLLIAGVALLAFSHVHAASRPCPEREARQFDFWIGDWNAEWTGKDGKKMTGTNTIRALLDSCVVQEQFRSDSTGFAGMSVSTFDIHTKQWKQTWVDNSSSYLDFSGKCEDGAMIFVRKAEKDGKQFLQRMRWYDITENAFLWNWERSDDNGKTWKVLWKISYTRR